MLAAFCALGVHPLRIYGLRKRLHEGGEALALPGGGVPEEETLHHGPRNSTGLLAGYA